MEKNIIERDNQFKNMYSEILTASALIAVTTSITVTATLRTIQSSYLLSKSTTIEGIRINRATCREIKFVSDSHCHEKFSLSGISYFS